MRWLGCGIISRVINNIPVIIIITNVIIQKVIEAVIIIVVKVVGRHNRISEGAQRGVGPNASKVVGFHPRSDVAAIFSPNILRHFHAT